MMERRSFTRAVAAMVIGRSIANRSAEAALKQNWKDDADAERVLKAVTSRQAPVPST
jgi:hypothetical protein